MTDGSEVWAIDRRVAVGGNRPTAADAVIESGDDTGAVLQAVFDGIEPLREPMGNPPSSPAGRHIHFGRGQFPWRSTVETGGTNAVRITGNGWASDLVAKEEMDSFIRFGQPPMVKGSHKGPVIEHLLVHAEDNAKHFVDFGTYTDLTQMNDINCWATTKSMIYGKADGPEEEFRFNDTKVFSNLTVSFGGSLAIFEDGPSGIPAGIRFRHCYCTRPGATNYGLVLRNPQRIIVHDFFTRVQRKGDVENPGGAIKIHNPEARFRNEPPTQQCLLQKVELESPNVEDATAITIEAPESATTPNRNHRIVFPRTGHQTRALKAVATEPGGIEDVELFGTQVPPERPDHVELRNTTDCRIDFRNGVRDAREVITIEGGSRNVVNGIGRSAGPPGQGGPWAEQPYEGATVLDTEDGAAYTYMGGTWRQIH